MEFEKELESFEPNLKRLVKRYNIDFLEECDIEQELRIHLFLKSNKFKKLKDISFKSWAYKVCKSKLIDLYRKYKCNNRSGSVSLNKYLDEGWDLREDKKIVKSSEILGN
jgi:DNA-directed RNA polymerase specialized sigma24 family protein